MASSSTQNPVDGDSDLSFEALTFGEDAGHIQDDKAGKKKSPKIKDRASSPEENETDKNASSVVVGTRNDADKIDVQSLLKKLEQFGVVKTSYFKEKQNFGFIQFLDASVVDAVVESINKDPAFLSDGVQLLAERGAPKSGELHGASMGTSLGTSFGAIPFSPSTPTPSMATPGAMMSSAQSTNAASVAVPASSTPIGTPTGTPVIEKPDTILVLKNLPFSLKQDQLQEILMAMNTTAPQSINLHFDNMGVFRGMAFIKYRALDDAIKVYESLNGYDCGGRKVRVEYKRKNKGQTDIPVEWQEEEDLKKLWEQVRDFSNNTNVNEISFTPNLTSNQRKHIHTMAEKLKLTHYSNGDGDLKYICIKKSVTTPTPVPSTPSATSLAAAVPASQNGFALPPVGDPRAIEIKGRRRRDSESVGNRQTGSPNGHNHGFGNLQVGSVEKEYRTRASSFTFNKNNTSSTPSGTSPHVSLDWRVQSPSGSLAQSPSIAGITIAPSRQPRGPDGSKGFSDLYRSARKHACTFVPVADNSAPEIPAVV